MPNVAFFSNHFARSGGTGITSYARHLVNVFRKLDNSFNVTPVATWSNCDREYLNTLKKDTGLKLLPTGRWLTPLLWWSIGIPKLEHLLDLNIDIVHANSLSYQVATSKPIVVTVHDIGPLIHPEYSQNNSYVVYKRGLEQAVKKADAIISVSHATADSMLEYVQQQYSIDLSNRIYVVHEGVADKFFQISDILPFDLKDEHGLLKFPFILAVGKISPRKNLDVVIKALKKIRANVPHHLITVGGDGWDYQEVKDLVKSLELEDRVHHLGYVNDEVLCTLYQRAHLFIYPSLFEGFGLPVLEAMASNCPVITSNISSLPEIAGDAALLVNPHSVGEVAEAMETVCNNDSYANELKRKGKERARQFSWKKSAEETARIYETLL